MFLLLRNFIVYMFDLDRGFILLRMNVRATVLCFLQVGVLRRRLSSNDEYMIKSVENIVRRKFRKFSFNYGLNRFDLDMSVLETSLLMMIMYC